jgi:hypothetical protein
VDSWGDKGERTGCWKREQSEERDFGSLIISGPKVKEPDELQDQHSEIGA